MTASKPEVQGWRVTRLSGNGYGRERTIVDSEIYNAEDPAFWLPGAMERHSIEPLIRLTDHEADRAADKAILEQLYRQRDDYAMHNMAVRQCTGIPGSVGISEPVEGFEDRPQDLAPAMREMALIIEADKARIAELEAALGDLLAIVSDSTGVVGYHLNGAVAEWGDFDVVSAACAALAQQGEE